jgi:hypothetical protein
VADSANASIGAINANNAAVTFVIPSTFTGGTLLAATGTANLDNATIGFDMANASGLAAGTTFTIVSAPTLNAAGLDGTIEVRTVPGDRRA